METFNKFKDWLLTGLLLFIAAMAVDIRNKVYDMDKKTIVIEYRINSLETRMLANEKSDDDQEKAISQIEGFLLPEKIELKSKPTDKK